MLVILTFSPLQNYICVYLTIQTQYDETWLDLICIFGLTQSLSSMTSKWKCLVFNVQCSCTFVPVTRLAHQLNAMDSVDWCCLLLLFKEIFGILCMCVCLCMNMTVHCSRFECIYVFAFHTSTVFCFCSSSMKSPIKCA